MKNNEEIFELFRENEHKLDAPPTPMAWDRIERKLDNKNTAKRKVLWNYYAAAAGILLLVVAGVFYLAPSNLNENTASPQFAEATNSKKMAVNEEPKPARPILMSHKEKQYYFGNQPIAANSVAGSTSENEKFNKSPLDKAEGGVSKYSYKWNDKSNLAKDQETNQEKGFVDATLDPDVTDKMIAQNLEKPKQLSPPTINTSAHSTAPTIITSAPETSAPVQPSPTLGASSSNPGTSSVWDGDELADDAEMVEDGIREEVEKQNDYLDSKTTADEVMQEEGAQLEKVAESVETKDRAAKEVKRKRAKKESYAAEMEPAMSEMESEYRDQSISNQSISPEPLAKASSDQMPASKSFQISQLKWMTGNWVNSETNTMEVWSTISPAQLIGKIYSLGTDSDSSPYETDLIQINKTRGKIVLNLQNELYDLVEIDGKKAIFKNQTNRKKVIKIIQSGNKLKIVNQQPNNTKTKILKKE